jgi:hypothetical protein
MITLLERPAAERGASGDLAAVRSRRSQAPVILKDGATYDVDANRFLADLPTNGVRTASGRYLQPGLFENPHKH